jgi:hypothetical protein
MSARDLSVTASSWLALACATSHVPRGPRASSSSPDPGPGEGLEATSADSPNVNPQNSTAGGRRLEIATKKAS